MGRRGSDPAEKAISAALMALTAACGGLVAGSDGTPARGGSGVGSIPSTEVEVSSGGSPTGAGGATSTTGGGEANEAGTDGTGGISPCAEGHTVNAMAIQPAVEFLIDTGSSMADTDAPSTQGQSKWAVTRQVLDQTFASLPPKWAVGVAYFNQPVGQSVYAGQQAVPIAPLTAEQLVAIHASLDAVTPAGMTPTLSAWQFTFDHLSSWSPSAPGYQGGGKFLVLVADSVPTINRDGATSGTGMNGTITQAEYDYFAQTVDSAFQAIGIKTFVVGVPGSEDPEGAAYDPLYELSLLAIAGGTTMAGCTPIAGTVVGCYDTLHQRQSTCLDSRGTYCHFDLTVTSDFATGLVNALSQIATPGWSCLYQIPPTGGPVIDPNGVRITYTPAGGPPETLTQSIDGCATGDWYFSAVDSNGQPTEIALCPSYCAASTLEGSSLDMTFTCLPD
jgi:hypothetical protein